MLNELEIVEYKLSDLERTLRLDSEFYKKEYIQIENILKSKKYQVLTDLVKVSDGNHMKISDSFVNEGIPYYRGQDVSSFFIEQSTPLCITESAFNAPVMKRSYIQKNDILLSIVGTIGKLSLVKKEDKATCSCKLAILRPKNLISNYISIFLGSKYGQSQIERFTRGAVQQGLILEDMNQLVVPFFSDNFREYIDTNIELSYEKLEKSKSLYKEAETILLKELDLLDFEPTKENIAIKSFSESFLETGRLDSEYYQPKYDEIVEKVKSYSEGWKYIESVLKVPIKNGTTPKGIIKAHIADSNYFFRAEAFNDDLTLNYESLYSLSNKIFENYLNISVNQNDILVSMTGTIGNVVIMNKKINGIINQNIVKLSVNDEIINYHTLALYIKTIGKKLLIREQTGNVQPYVNIPNFSNLIVPIIDLSIQTKIEKKIKISFQLKSESIELLALAKRAVEVAIEEGEDVALEMIR